MNVFPYLVFSLFFLLIFSAGLFITPLRFRKSVLASAVLSAPTSLTTFVFVPDYWDPVRILPYELGAEDIIFAFATGGICWLFIILILNRKYSIECNTQINLRHYTGFLLFGGILYILWLLTGIHKMLATVITILIIGYWIMKRRSGYRIISIIGALGFTVIYSVYLLIVQAVFPDFFQQWSLHNLSGFMILGIPMEEILWAGATGAVWPLIVAYLLNLQMVRKEILIDSIDQLENKEITEYI